MLPRKEFRFALSFCATAGAYCGVFHFYFEAASGLMNQIGLNPDSEVTATVWTDGQGYQYEAAILRGTDLCVCGKARKRLYKQDIKHRCFHRHMHFMPPLPGSEFTSLSGSGI